jgi:hypothetical protein
VSAKDDPYFLTKAQRDSLRETNERYNDEENVVTRNEVFRMLNTIDGMEPLMDRIYGLMERYSEECKRLDDENKRLRAALEAK